jgi:hypothetical protein
LLHACAHNPTGVDPTKDQWKAIADVIEVCSCYSIAAESLFLTFLLIRIIILVEEAFPVL